MPNHIDAQAPVSAARNLNVSFTDGTGQDERQFVERRGNGWVEHDTCADLGDAMRCRSTITNAHAASVDADEEPSAGAISERLERWVHADGRRRTDRMHDGVANDFSMRRLLCSFGDVHEVAATTAFDVRTRWLSTIGTGLDDLKQAAARRPRGSLNGGQDTFAASGARNKDTKAIVETANTSSARSQRVDEDDLLFGRARRMGTVLGTSVSRSRDHRGESLGQSVPMCIDMVLVAVSFAERTV